MAWREYADYTESVDDVRTALQEAFQNTNYLRDAIRENPVHNPSFDIWQRGTSFASGASQFTTDRFKFRRGSNDAGATCSRQSGLLLPTPTPYACRVQRDSLNALTTTLYHGQQIESVDAEQFAGKSVYVIVEAAAGANFSETDGELTCMLYTGTGVDEVVSESAGFATGNSTFTSAKAISTTPTAIAFGPFAIPANATEIAWFLNYDPTSSAGAADYFDYGNSRIVTEAALAFVKRPNPLEWEICRRFYENIPGANSGLSAAQVSAVAGYRVGTTYIFFDGVFRTPKRTKPSLTKSIGSFSSGAEPATNNIGATTSSGSWLTRTGVLSVTDHAATGRDSWLFYLTATTFGGSAGDRCDLYLGPSALIGYSAEIE